MASQRGEVPAAVRVRAGQPVGKARRGTSGGDSVGVTSGGGGWACFVQRGQATERRDRARGECGQKGEPL